MRDTRSRQTNPQGAFIVWNYKERITADSTSDPHEIESVVINTFDLVSMHTSKNKSQPAGTFEVRLAPRINWVAKLTPGSWCVILMSRDKIPSLHTSSEPFITENNPGKADKKLVKMLGRITSVRLSVTVDQATGARKTEYIVSGQDWGSVFSSNLYIDPIARNNNFDGLTTVGHAERILFERLTTDYLDKRVELPTAGGVVKALIKLWGSPLANIVPTVSAAFSQSNIPEAPLISSGAQYKLPTQVASYFGFGNFLQASVNFADLIKVKEGVLEKYDSYSGDNQDAHGFLNPSSLYGVHTFWQLLTENCNPTLNELVADMTWDDDKANLTLYRRVRPFLTRDDFDGALEPQVKNNVSLFKNVRRVYVPKRDILTVNAGTNLDEKINFIEVKPQPAFLSANHDVVVKLQSQFIDAKAYERDGFKPLIVKPTYLPYNGGEVAPLEATQWKFLLKEWHFGKDTMLNGAISFIGLSDYIGVGDNIIIDASAIGIPFNKSQADKVLNDGGPLGLGQTDGNSDSVYLLAHVEQIDNTFETNQETGARSFISTVRFVRGVLTDKNGNLIGEGGGLGGLASSPFSTLSSSPSKSTALDKNADEMNSDDLINRNVVSHAGSDDPLTGEFEEQGDDNEDDGFGLT